MTSLAAKRVAGGGGMPAGILRATLLAAAVVASCTWPPRWAAADLALVEGLAGKSSFLIISRIIRLHDQARLFWN